MKKPKSQHTRGNSILQTDKQVVGADRLVASLLNSQKLSMDEIQHLKQLIDHHSITVEYLLL